MQIPVGNMNAMKVGLSDLIPFRGIDNYTKRNDLYSPKETFQRIGAGKNVQDEIKKLARYNLLLTYNIIFTIGLCTLAEVGILKGLQELVK